MNINFLDRHLPLYNLFACIFIFLVLPSYVLGECTCDIEEEDRDKTHQALKYKLGAIASILVAGAIGVCLPILGKSFEALRPEKNIFFVIKAFAAGVILSTGFIHVLPDAFKKLTSPCLHENPWGKFPFTGFVAMMATIGTLMVDASATSYYTKSHFNMSKPGKYPGDEEMVQQHEGHVHVHTHGTHGHAHGAIPSADSELLRHRIISQAKFKSGAIAIMVLFFSLTTPVGIAIGIGISISNVYKENSPPALIVEGIFNAASAGILIYMSLVDLLAADFMNTKVQTNRGLQIAVNISLLLGAGCMSLLAKWA
ncbi:hypothetical protein Pint_36705 [Pistacia integerrima]|uniref:Uncharacterized protein n=1 Tax=Pistacia integerrima TaxID=434235 RepID=A0ACC0Y353_9ROSI|nr:hypothetical protein Pint_36705 [Pistacia integerrima]